MGYLWLNVSQEAKQKKIDKELKTTSMSVLLIVGLKCTLAASLAAPGESWVTVGLCNDQAGIWHRSIHVGITLARFINVLLTNLLTYTVSMPTVQTDRRTDARPLSYAIRYGLGQRKNRSVKKIRCKCSHSACCQQPT